MSSTARFTKKGLKGFARRKMGYKKMSAKKMSKIRMGYGYYKLRLNFTLQSNSATGANFAYQVSNTNPSSVYARDNGAFGGSFTDWTYIGSLYDNYKVKAVKLKFIPVRPNDTSSTASFQPCYVTFDPDTSNLYTVITNPDSALQYDRTQVKNLSRPWSYYVKNPKYTVNGQPMGWMDVASPSSLGCISIFADSFPTTTNFPWGTMVVTYYMTCKNRR